MLVAGGLYFFRLLLAINVTNSSNYVASVTMPGIDGGDTAARDTHVFLPRSSKVNQNLIPHMMCLV